eukprot:Polyplicarium_translucidae@DN3055_c0_g1_i1.p1
MNEYGQATALEVLSNFTPATPDELYDVLNCLDDRLRHASPAVVAACVKAFLRQTEDHPALFCDVLRRLRAPMLTLVATAAPEVAHPLLLQMKLIIQKCLGSDVLYSLGKSLFEHDFKLFFCRHNDQSYVKPIKLDILALIATESNAQALQIELAEYASGDPDAEIARHSIRALGHIALQLEAAVDPVVEQLVAFLSLDVPSVVAESLCALKDLLRKYRKLIVSHHLPALVRAIETALDAVTDPRGMAATVWIIGEFVNDIPEAPYMLERLVSLLGPAEAAETGGAPSEYRHLDAVRHASVVPLLLTACVKAFVRRAPESRRALTKLLRYTLRSFDNSDCRDRALFYMRLLQGFIPPGADLEAIVCGDKPPIEDPVRDQNNVELVERVFAEINTLASVYMQPSANFLIQKSIPFGGRQQRAAPKSLEDEEESLEGRALVESHKGGTLAPEFVEADARAPPDATAACTHLLLDMQEAPSPDQPKPGPAETRSVAGNRGTELDLHSLDLHSIFSNTKPADDFVFRADVAPMEPERYQEEWMRNDGYTERRQLRALCGGPEQVEEDCASHNVFCIASGGGEAQVKLFLYADGCRKGDRDDNRCAV